MHTFAYKLELTTGGKIEGKSRINTASQKMTRLYFWGAFIAEHEFSALITSAMIYDILKDDNLELDITGDQTNSNTT